MTNRLRRRVGRLLWALTGRGIRLSHAYKRTRRRFICAWKQWRGTPAERTWLVNLDLEGALAKDDLERLARLLGPPTMFRPEWGWSGRRDPGRLLARWTSFVATIEGRRR